MKRMLLLFVLLALGRMSMAKKPVTSHDNSSGTAVTYMDLSYHYLKPCSDTVVLVARVYNRPTPKYTVVWYNGAVGDSIYVSVALNNILPSYTAVLKNPLGTVIDRDTVKVLPQQALNPTIEIHRSAILNNDTLMAFPQQPATSVEYLYKWYRGIWEIQVGNYPMLINPQPGTYKVYVRDRAGCSGVSDTVQFTRTSDTSQVASISPNGDLASRFASINAREEVTLGANKVKAFPNPSTGQVSLQFEKAIQKKVTVIVYNLNGRVMYNRTTYQQLQPLDLSALPKGYYLIELTGEGEKKVLPLILQ
ncbi:T9SS type A sorting domain-containing protein [Chitinophaga filiformis]|uniref:T9SS type A sorting domain-containing protein n=1 Tax=Chitinophaga filiformis TaxID=104663 RepID=UPI001F18583C|nr:T9SS type A sorting domain-containing protein [Chitinophaga filiformis]MCF6402674.1 T9SS type A sorting domain-containing protein [Chitinophaga filiformis]MCF6403408.1 T9SS type A sorting domain-containing protein [Chitinophaga filiformis]